MMEQSVMKEKQTVRILAVDDHEMTTVGYKYILENGVYNDFEVKVETAKSFDLGKQKIESSVRALKYDIILLDIQLFKPEDKDSRTGEDLGLIAREVAPDSKIVFMSSFSDAHRITSICKSVNPDGYMVKSEIDERTLLAMVETVMSTPPYYTASALKVFRLRMSNDIVIDEQDRKILYHLSIGKRTKDIPEIISASHATVETRKRQLKIMFGIENGNDLALIEQARQRGFI